ncbi:MAG: hypothetical protein Q9197_000928 [Variospora fuerteventurae]
MSFFKKMVDKIEDMVGDDDKKDKKAKEDKQEHGEGTKDQSSYQNYQQAPFGSQPPGAQPFSPPNPTGGPPLPPGWIAQWDANSQRYYFLEQATGRTQWEPPHQIVGSHSGPPPFGAPLMGSHGYDQHGPSTGGYYSQEVRHTVEGSHGGGPKEMYVKEEKKEKKEGKGGMLAAGAGGLAVGAVGGAMIAHAAGDDSSDDERQQVYQQQPTGGGMQPAYYQEPAPTGPPPLEQPPPGSAHGSVSSSDKEDLAEAREDYENASDASDREEAREEYEEQYEETYGSD